MFARVRVVSLVVVLATWVTSARRAEVDLHVGATGAAANAKPDVSAMEMCPQSSVIEPGADVAYFKAQRAALGISQCTKQDVCLLMRQLDAAFYEKSRRGDVGDVFLPQHAWLEKGRCASAGRGARMVPVRKLSICKKQAAKQKIYSVQLVKEASKDKFPEGCVIKTVDSKKTAHFNPFQSDAEASLVYKPKGDEAWASNTKIVKSQLCLLDVTLDPASAYYYSPYKLKQSMAERTAFSTTCSFGKMAALYNLRKTQSPCAEILAWRPNWRFKSAAEALAAADAAGPHGQNIRDDVERLRQKFVLINVLTNHWCPDTWTFALGTSAHTPTATTCLAPRLPPWVQDPHSPDDEVEAEKVEVALEGKEKKAQIIPQRDDKLALTEATCGGVTDLVDDSLATVLKGAPAVPPDFFEKALLAEE